MFELPDLNGEDAPPPDSLMTLEQYLAFCHFCLTNNPRTKEESCMDRKTGEEDMREPFRIVEG
ncbi:MAG: hypothetical protein AAF514_12630 [Verrucomicrobiota bacterium]